MSSDPGSRVPPVSRIEVITSVERRRRWPIAEKVRLVEEAMQPGMSVSYVARRNGVSPSLLFSWKRRMLEGGFVELPLFDRTVGYCAWARMNSRGERIRSPE